MRRFILLLLSAGLWTGCARYDMLLTNSVRITNISRPKLDPAYGVYTYKDVTGAEHHVSAGRVVEIMPHSSKNEPGINNPNAPQ